MWARLIVVVKITILAFGLPGVVGAAGNAGHGDDGMRLLAMVAFTAPGWESGGSERCATSGSFDR